MVYVPPAKDGVSIITPCYNDGRFLTEALDSVRAVGARIPYEVIVIDDGSTDPETVALIDMLEELYPDLNLRVLRNGENKGLPITRNRGLLAARYEYIFQLDADNKLGVDPEVLANGGGYFERGYNALRSNQDLLMVYCHGPVFGAREGTIGLGPYNKKILCGYNMLDTHSMYRRREALAIGGFDMGGDRAYRDWVLAVGLHNRRVKMGRSAHVLRYQEPLFYYRIRNDHTNVQSNIDPEQTRANTIMRMIELYPEFYAKHFSGLQGEALFDAVYNLDIVGLDHEDVPECLFGRTRSVLRHAWRHVTHIPYEVGCALRGRDMLDDLFGSYAAELRPV